MKPENIILLGFVDRAAKYLEKHLDDSSDTATSRTDNISLNSLRDELNKNLDASALNGHETTTQLLQEGYDAFDRFISSHEDDSLVDEIDKLFDVDFNEQSSEDDIARLLDYYNLNDTASRRAETKNESDSSFEMSDEDEELLKLISSNVNRINEPVKETPKKQKTVYSNDDSFASIYSRLTDENGDASMIRFSNPGIIPDDQTAYTVRDNPLPDMTGYRTYDPDIYADKKIDPVSMENIISNRPIEAPDENDIISLVKEMQKSDEQYYGHILDVKPQPPVVEKKEENKDRPGYTNYGNDLLDDLRKKMVEQDKRKKRFDEEFSAIHEKIHEIYPYLTHEFIKNVYYMKDEIANEFPFNIKVIILHRIHFKTVESLRQFVEIALNHDYSINADENKLIVDVFKQHINVDGKIITSIYEIANQSALLKAEYEGYRVLYQDGRKA